MINCLKSGKWVWVVILIFTGFACCHNKSTSTIAPSGYRIPCVMGQYQPVPGDILFQDLYCGPLCDAIKAVTEGHEGANFAHVGMVSRVEYGTEVWVIEAVSEGVVETSLEAFLARSCDAKGRPPVFLGRLKPNYRHLIPDALAYAKGFLGMPYDSVYAIDNNSFYCSELIYEAFLLANEGLPLFELEPMTFKDPETGVSFPGWVGHYDTLGIAIPEGEPGLNPGGMSKAQFLDIIYAYGRPEGYSGKIGILQTNTQLYRDNPRQALPAPLNCPKHPYCYYEEDEECPCP